MIEKITTADAPAAVGHYSQAICVNGMVFTSGQIALDPVTGELVGTTVEEQTEQVIKNLTAVLAAAECTLDNVVKTTCYVTDKADFAKFNAAYAKLMTPAVAPARSCIAAKSLPKGALVEIEVIAVK